MSDLIFTSYLENNELKIKIVKDSEAFWLNLINNFKQKCGPNIRQPTINKWKQNTNVSFGEHVIGHAAYWIIYEQNQLTHAQTGKELAKYSLYKRLNLVLTYMGYIPN